MKVQIVLDSGEITNVYVSDPLQVPIVDVMNGDDMSMPPLVMETEKLED